MDTIFVFINLCYLTQDDIFTVQYRHMSPHFILDVLEKPVILLTVFGLHGLVPYQNRLAGG